MTSRPTTPGATTPGGNGLAHYQLGDSLGKGAFAQVFRALNWTTGETVAIKQIQLSTIARGDLGEIMSEIDLLKNLHHPNIVQYKGFVKTKDYLNIILEYCENGSLHNICKRFGKFPENLVAVYISQVLDGLVYLHDQGVIHRDIKGANILTNKDGTVKLADFGVATAQVSDGAVVGSPYWMAPEVIEQLGATTASDVWSVGCVVIELLEGKPPYHFLSPMPALFRIVQDDCPPIPEGASPIVKDFLYHCFQKDYNLRISAKKLLKHPWMVSAKKQLAMQRKPATGRPLSNYDYAETIQRVQAWNEALKSPPRSTTSKNRIPPRVDSPTPSPPSPPLLVRKSNSPTLARSTHGNTAAVSLKSVAPVPMAPLRSPEEQTDNWDDDFEEDILLTKLHGLDKAGFDEEKAEDINLQTIRPSKSPSTSPVSLPIAPSANMSAIIEDYSDVLEEAEEDLDWTLQYFQARNPNNRGLIWPSDIHTVGLVAGPLTTSPGPKTAPLPLDSPVPSPPSTIFRRSPLSHTPIRRPSSATPPGTYSRATSLAAAGTGSWGRADAKRAASTSELERYTEGEDEGYDDIFGKVGVSASDQSMGTLQLQTRLSNRSWRDEDSGGEDPFADIEEEFGEEDLDANLQRDKHARLCATVNQLVEELVPNAPDYALREICDQLMVVMGDAPEMQLQLVSSHGMLAILEVLEAKPSRDVIIRLLKIVNLLVTSDLGVLESFCLIGGIPVLTEFTSKKYSSECRLEASNVIQLLCHTSVLTLQMFISCRGLKILVEILDEDYVENAGLVSHALNSITSVFELQSPTPKNDFCRMFIREGLLDPLSSALINVTNGKGCETAGEMKIRIIQIILIFSQVSQSDVYVRNAIGTRKVIRRLLRGCEILEPEYLVALLKAIKHLSMSQSLLDTLQNANAIEILIELLEKHNSCSPHYTESSNHIFQTCYNLCRLNKGRQEEAAQAGIIPCLKRVIEANSPLRQFALPVLCDLASAGKGCRTMLWQHDGLHIYLGLLSDPYFQVSALEAIVQWLQDDTARVEDVLTEPWSLDCLVECFASSKANSFENILEPLIKIIRLCPTSMSIGCAREAFFTRLVDRLTHTKHKPVVRLNLLRILRAICDVHPDKATLVRKFELYSVVEKLSQSDNAVLVRELARDILPILGSPLHAAGLRNSTSPMRSQRSLSHLEGRGDASSMRRIRPALPRPENLSGSDTPGPNSFRLGVTTLAPRKRANRRAASEASVSAFTPPNVSSASALNSPSSGLVKKVRPAGARRPASTLAVLTAPPPDVYTSGSIRRHMPE